MQTILLKKDYILLYVLLGLVYISGLWIPLMENDSAQHATMAMRMYLESDFLNIYRGNQAYLDKPHMHFWLAAFAFKIFGISQWSYRIPALLFTLLGAISCYRLAKELYGNKASHIAALIFLSAQAIILANHDVRTDAVLTGATIFSIWQLVMFINKEHLIHIVLGAVGAGIAFSTKGQLGIFVIGMCILSYLLYNRKWKVLLNWKIGVGIIIFIATIFPVLYAYYVQFDLHPEKIIKGENNVSGVKFILWDQSFNRLTAKGFSETKTDYFFFFHTLLWAFLPWSVIAYAALFSRLKMLWITKFKYEKGVEIFTSVGFLLIVIVMGFSKSKLPHYLNSLLPIASILCAGYLVFLFNNKKEKINRVLLLANNIVLILGSVFICFLIFWAFPLPHLIIVLCYLILIAGFYFIFITAMNKVRRIIVVSVYFMVFINFCLNTQFYPNLLKYQAGNNVAKIISSESINPNDIFILNGKSSWSLNFYTKRFTPVVNIEDVNKSLKNGQWLFLYDDQLKILKNQQILSFNNQYEINHYRITRLKGSFLNPNTRDNVLEKAYLVQVLF